MKIKDFHLNLFNVYRRVMVMNIELLKGNDSL